MNVETQSDDNGNTKFNGYLKTHRWIGEDMVFSCQPAW